MNIRTIIDRSVAVLLQPQFYFASDEDILDFGDGVVYSAIMAVLGGLIAALVSDGGVTSGLAGLIWLLIINPVVTVISVFIMAGIILVLCHRLGGRGDYSDSFHVAASAAALIPIAQLLSPLPLLVVSMAWGWWIVSRGAIHIHQVPSGKAESAFAALYAVLTIIAFTAS